MASSRVLICFVMCVLFSYRSIDSVILSVSFIGIFTYRFLMSKVFILWFSFIFSFVRLSASVTEFITLYWLLRCKCRLSVSVRCFATLMLVRWYCLSLV